MSKNLGLLLARSVAHQRLFNSLLMRSRFFPRYSEEDLLNRKYSFMARLQVIPDGTMEGREFIYHADLIQKDIAEEEKQRKLDAAMRRANPGRR